MQDYLTQLARRVRQPELVVQPRSLSSFELLRYSSESFEGNEPGVHGLQVPAHRLRATIDEWMDHAEGRNRNESDTARLVPDASLTEKMGQPYRREPVDSVVDRTELDHRPWGTAQAVEADKPAIESYEEVVRGTRKVIEPSVRKEQSSREPSVSSSPEPREFSAHARHVTKTEHKSEQPPCELKPSGLRESTEKQEPAIRSARERGESRVITERLETRESQGAPFSRIVPKGEVHFEDDLRASKWLIGQKTDGIPNVTPIPSGEKRRPHAESPSPSHTVEQRVLSPTIQVSIGRIEVRATTAPVPSKKLQAKSSAMGLDEYLARRREGLR